MAHIHKFPNDRQTGEDIKLTQSMHTHEFDGSRVSESEDTPAHKHMYAGMISSEPISIGVHEAEQHGNEYRTSEQVNPVTNITQDLSEKELMDKFKRVGMTDEEIAIAIQFGHR